MEWMPSKLIGFLHLKKLNIMKLELKHLAPYLPYKLNYFIDFEDGDVAVYEMIGMFNDSGEIYLDGYETDLDSKNCKPILRPLSDLTKEINKGNLGILSQLSMKDLRNIKNNRILFISLMGYNELLKQHFDVFGLIEKGLAIDINKALK